jgi:thiol-disulfide isomerase/thioredoxin
VNSRILRIVRIVSLIMIFVLAGFYVGLYVWTDRPDSAPSTRQPSEFVATLPEISLPDLHGETRSISEWSGRPLVINFWATWCAPCLREMPLLQTLHQERAGSALTVIGIAIDRLDAVTGFIAQAGITYPILAGQQDAMRIAEQFGLEFVALPFTVFTAPDGQVLLLHSGELRAEKLREILAISDRVAQGQLAAAEARRLLAPPADPRSGSLPKKPFDRIFL